MALNLKGCLSERPHHCPLTRHVSFLTRWTISPLLSTTSRLPLSLEFSEESSSTTRSGTAPVTRITSTWRRPATCIKEAEHHAGTGIPRTTQTWDRKHSAIPLVSSTTVTAWPPPATGNNTPRARPFHWLTFQLSCLTLSQIYLPTTCLLRSSSLLTLFYRTAHE